MGKVWFAFTVLMVVGLVGTPVVYLLVDSAEPLVSNGTKIVYNLSYKYANGTTKTTTLTISYIKDIVLMMNITSPILAISSVSNAVVNEYLPATYITFATGNTSIMSMFPFYPVTLDEILSSPQYKIKDLNTVTTETYSSSLIGNDTSRLTYAIEMGSYLIKEVHMVVVGVNDGTGWRSPTSSDYPEDTIVEFTLTLRSSGTAVRYILGLKLYSFMLFVVGLVGTTGFLVIAVRKTLVY